MKKFKYLIFVIILFMIVPINCMAITNDFNINSNMLILDTTNTNADNNSESNRTDDPYPDFFPDLEEEQKENNCKTIFVKKDEATGEESFTELGSFMQDLFTLIKIATPVIIIILTTIDYVKAIASSNADDMKKTNSRTIKRLIIGLIIFFLPFILDILFNLFGLYDLSRCNIGT